MFKKYVCRRDLIGFAAGVAATVAGIAVSKCPKTRELIVKGMAKGIKIQQNAQEAIQNMREEAEDLVLEAQKEAQEELEIEE